MGYEKKWASLWYQYLRKFEKKIEKIGLGSFNPCFFRQKFGKNRGFPNHLLWNNNERDFSSDKDIFL